MSEAYARDFGDGVEKICTQVDADIFYPEKENLASTKEAKEHCTLCENRIPCLREALEKDIKFGVWGGMNTRERRKLVKRMGKIAA